MFTKSKGQGMIAEIIIFSMAIFMGFVIFIFLSSSQAEFENNVNKDIESSIESINDRSTLTVILNDNVWRAPGVDQRYNDMTAIELTSHYFSTDEPVHIHGTEHSRSKVKNDLETYYSYKMAQTFSQKPKKQDYMINITDGKGNYLGAVENNGREGFGNTVSVPLQLSSGKPGEVTMWVRGTGGVFSVE